MVGDEFLVEDRQKNVFISGKRDRLEIVSAIIAITQQPSSISRIIGNANLNYSLLKEYLRFMISKRLIEKREVARGTKKKLTVYRTTEKGNRFLELYCESLILLHGEDFLQKNRDLAEAYLLQYCRKNKLTLSLNLHKSANLKIKSGKDGLTSESLNRVDKYS